MLKRISVALLFILVLTMGIATVSATEYRDWPEGWSRHREIGQTSYDTRRMEYPWLIQDNLLFTLGYDSRQGILELSVYDLSRRKVTERIVILESDRNVSSFDMAAGNDGIHVVWALDGEVKDIFHVVLDQDLEFAAPTEPVYSTFESVSALLLAIGEQQQHIFWSEMARGGVVLCFSPLGNSLERNQFEELPSGSRAHQVMVDQFGRIHLLWHETRRVEDYRNLHYGLLDSNLNTIETTLLGNTGTNENPSGDMVMVDGVLHVVWTEVVRGALGGRHPISLRYQSFEDGQPLSAAVWASASMRAGLQPTLAADENGELRMVWSQSTGGHLEIYFGKIQDGQLASPQRLTYATYAYIMPKVFVWEGHDYVLFEQIESVYRKLRIMDTAKPEIPKVWDRVGLDSNHIISSIFYRIGLASVMSGVYTILSTIPVIVATLFIYILHKLFGSPDSKLSFLLQIFLVSALVFFQLSAFSAVSLQPYLLEGMYQVFMFVLITTIVLGVFAKFASTNKDEPFVYGAAAFVWLYLWHFVSILTSLPYVIN